MKVAVIAPTPQLKKYSSLGDLHLCLAEHVNNSSAYRAYFKEEVARGKHVILDNSCHENGQSEHPTALIKAIEALNPNEVVLPDKLFDAESTVELSCAGYKRLEPYLRDRRVMVVPQGKTFNDWCWCLDQLVRLPVDTVGISKDYDSWDGGFTRLIEEVLMYTVDIHLLGWAKDGRVLGQLSRDYGYYIRSTDSAKPLVYAFKDIVLPTPEESTLPWPEYPHRDKDFFTSDRDPYPNVSKANIDTFKAWAQEKDN